MPLMRLSRVDLPEPLRPMMTVSVAGRDADADPVEHAAPVHAGAETATDRVQDQHAALAPGS